MNKYLTLSFVALAAVACNSVSTKTTLQGKFSGADVPEEIGIVVPGVVDTTVKLQNASFKLEAPVNKTVVGTATAAGSRTAFILDGTVLNFAIENGALTCKSDKPAVSLTSRLDEFSQKDRELNMEYRTGMSAIADSTGISDEKKEELQEEFYNSFIEKYKNYNFGVVDANKDNILSVYALQNVYSELSDDSLETVIASLDSAVVAGNRFVSSVKKSIVSRKSTAEGMQFTDFSVMQPNGKEAKLSDYVGKGKYVLVDFWASWCRPCKHEIPNVKAVYDKHHGKDFDVLSVAVWEKTPKESLDTAKAYGVNWNQIVDAKSVPTDIYGIVGIPHIILFGPDGVIIKRGLYGDAIEEEVSKYVK